MQRMQGALEDVPRRLEAGDGSRSSVEAVAADVAYAAQLVNVCDKPPKSAAAALQRARTAVNAAKIKLQQ